MQHLAELIFIIAGSGVVLLLSLRHRRLSSKERSATATAAFGLLLCGRYAALIHNPTNWVFAIGVGGMMLHLAYYNLGFADEQQVSAE